MYSIMIAEDSKPILRHIQRMVQAMELPVRVAATASNGLEALEKLKSQPADILLTDIRMPKLDGLELIEHSKQANPRLLAVLITGYSDFEYARKAVNLQAFDYLLKPVEEQQLTEVLQRLVEKLEERQQSDRRLWEGAVEPRFLASMVFGADLYAGDKFMLLLGRRPFALAAAWTEARIRTALEKAYDSGSFWLLPAARPEQFLLLGDEADLKAEGSAELWAEQVSGILEADGLPAVVLAEPSPAGILLLNTIYGKLDRLMREQLTVSGTFAETSCSSKAEEHLLTGGEADKLTVYTQLADLLANRQKDRFLLLLRQQLPNLQGGQVRLAELERFVRFLADAFSVALERERPEETEADPGEEVRRMLASESLEAFEDELLVWEAGKFELLLEPNRKSGEELFAQLDAYLKSHLYAQLTISDAASHFYVSPSYISRIVKRYSNSTFVHYYMDLKMAEARRLLVTGQNAKIKDVAELLGFEDQHYFSKVFKEYSGCSPTEYKDKGTSADL
ncbi:hypothetical protein AWM70_21095 [Paenibacillus yonginensis]|uniref:Two-component system response regulator n=1 Tax=Paenibacillus yonginensis TaxID=1462996 RepID=A0A1B1N5P7_9BACL|nr:response regulator [Paenibacillus yonginensis]ANS76771.1 hypothetical protein AWM70_21095 [Paenibacillus yonginensis]